MGAAFFRPCPGHFGVELFFIISGFVILMTAERIGTLDGFVLSRLTRLMPAFLVALLIATAILIVAPMLPPLGTPTPLQFLANLTMAPSLFEQTPIDLPDWTLTYELVFYTYALVLSFGLLGSIEWLGLFAVALGTLCLLTVDMRPHHRAAILLMLHYSNFFVIGICLYRLYARTARPVTYIALVTAIAANAIGGGELSFYASSPLYLTLGAAFALVVWFATSRYQRLLLWPPSVYLGSISYPLYLVHLVPGFEIIRFGIAHGWSPSQERSRHALPRWRLRQSCITWWRYPARAGRAHSSSDGWGRLSLSHLGRRVHPRWSRAWNLCNGSNVGPAALLAFASS